MPPSEASSPDPHLGRVLEGRYRVEALLGTGGIGAVYRGAHLTLGKPVAIKLLRPEFAKVPEFLARFDREARALSRMSHPNVVSVMDFGVAGEFPYLVMELLEGRSLEAAIEQGPVGMTRALAIGKQILSTLAYAHDQGVVHRDLKPQNVMLIDQPGLSDMVKILDFGLAKIVDEIKKQGEPTLTKHGMIFGTPAYMSPEQAAGDPADARSDLYSAGVMLFELLAGRPPFVSDSPVDLIRKHIMTRPPRIADVAPEAGVPELLDRVITRSLQKQKSARHQSAREFLEAVQEAADVASSSSEPITGETRKYAPIRATTRSALRTFLARPEMQGALKAIEARRRWLPMAAVAILLLVLLAIALAPSSVEPSSPGPNQAAPRRVERGTLDARRGSKAAARRKGPSAPAPAPARPTARVAATAAEGTDPWRAADLPPELRRAILLVDRGQFEESEGYAKVYVKTHRADPLAHLVLGHGYCGRGWRRDGLWRYRLAIRTDPSMRNDPRLLQNLVDSLGDERVSREAAAMISEVYGARASAVLLEATRSSRTMLGAHAALGLLESMGRASDVDRVGLAVADLGRARRCADRQAALAALDGERDARVPPALEALRTDPEAVLCLGTALDGAIARLR